MAVSENRIPQIDTLRGLAAFVVLVWHYQHFQPLTSPFYSQMKFFYQHGAIAVELFFMLSGFIFFHLYAERVREGSIHLREFFWARFSRLYPLHFLTLFVVTIAQLVHLVLRERTFVYVHFDVWHFFLNLTFLQYGWLDSGLSFNGPAWSISIELMLYFVFFAVARRFTHLLLPAFVLSMFGLVCIRNGFNFNLPGLTLDFARGISGFFIGGLLCQGVHWLRLRQPQWLPAVGGFGVLVALVVFLLTPTAPGQFSRDWLGSMRLVYLGVGMPALILGVIFCPILERACRWRGLSYWGEISYSTYLLHFPVQLLFVLAGPFLGIDFSSWKVALLYYASVFFVSSLSYRYFERPWMRRLRAKPLFSA